MNMSEKEISNEEIINKISDYINTSITDDNTDVLGLVKILNDRIGAYELRDTIEKRDKLRNLLSVNISNLSYNTRGTNHNSFTPDFINSFRNIYISILGHLDELEEIEKNIAAKEAYYAKK